ncbi:hypothetical protein INR49_010051 [Caranx melampygus]|nr:hypothetical protein INR49_010051 [Caranx melampygus]
MRPAGPPQPPAASCDLSRAVRSWSQPDRGRKVSLQPCRRDKAILQVERPDLMTYQPHLSFSPLDPPRRERSLSPPPTSPTMSPEVKGRRAESESGSPGGSTLQLNAGRKISTSLQHFHRPDNGTNIYRKPPIYKQDVKHLDGSSVIKSAKFPAAQPPDPNQPSKIETEYWPCPPSLAAMGNTHTHTHTRRVRLCLWAELTLYLNSCRDRVEEEEAGGGRRVRGPDGRSQDPAGAGAGEDQVQPGTFDPEGGERKGREGRSVQEEDAVTARQNTHAHEFVSRCFKVSVTFRFDQNAVS